MTEQATSGTRWHLAGDWFDVCKCAIPCPCTFAQPPTYGDCEGVLVWHIREGNFGEVRLDDLNVLMLGSFEGNPWAGTHTDPYAAVFLDERADDRQRAALGAVFGGEAGGWPAEFGQMFHPEMRGMDVVPIHVEIDEDLATWRAEIPGRVTATAEALTGPTTPDGARVQVHNAPGAEVGPGQVATWGRATVDRADAFGFSWDRTGKSSKYFPFDWSGSD
ncbi:MULTISPECIES: DUF1326 domain-containing protein [Streptomyces]|uniref:DUF1326 domain-containing protein n=1 Tax=Streptomyces viridochromogenes TaxID=1938 RepID=A0A0L8JQ47_STRVR|nr:MULTISPECIES: DUF1326 domain-containing protein [Streptomyces]KOG15730.1 hypothetical protein ADK34_27150 [Streptomyces viridochromogenes]